jgi:hypothetical protein
MFALVTCSTACAQSDPCEVHNSTRCSLYSGVCFDKQGCYDGLCSRAGIASGIFGSAMLLSDELIWHV